MIDTPKNTEVETKELLEKIITHLEHIDRRDRIRLWGGFVRSLLSLIPTIIFLWTLWYVSENTDALLRKIANIAVEVTSGSTSTLQKSTDFWESIWQKK